MKLSEHKARSLEQLIKTFDRFGLMEPYLITIEMKPGASLNKYSDIIYDQPQKVYGLVIRIMNEEGIVRRITIENDTD
jgi:hypothetical protein